jgi:hypothetical protein
MMSSETVQSSVYKEGEIKKGRNLPLLVAKRNVSNFLKVD